MAVAGAVAAARMTAGLAFLIVGAKVSRVLTLHAECTSDFVKSLNLSFGKVLGTTEHLCLVKKLCIEFNGFHLVISIEKRIGECKCTVVFKKYSIEVLEVLGNCIGNFFCRRCAVFSNRNTSESSEQ